MTPPASVGIRRPHLATVFFVSVLLAQIAPAGATHQQTTGSADNRQVVAGASGVIFTLQLSHPGGMGAPIDWVLAIPPQSPAGQPLVVPSSGTSAGWTSEVVAPPPSVLFSGGSLSPGGTATFRVVGDVGQPAADTCSSWRILVSSDGGDTTSEVKATSADTLTGCVRVTQVTNVGLVAPAGAVDGSVTAGQADTCVRVHIANTGSGDAIVIPGLAGSGFSSGPPLGVLDGEPPCTGPPLSDGEIGIAAGATGLSDFIVGFGASPGTATMFGRASGATTTAVERSTTVTVQTPAELEYASETFYPRAVRPSQEDVTFQLSLLKSPEDAPSIQFDAEGTTLSLPGCLGSPLIFPSSIVSESATQLVFEGCDIASVSDGLYDATVTYRYVDANGYVREGSVADLEPVRVDGLAPSGSASLAPPSGQPGVKNGDSLSFAGSVVDYDPEARNFVPCSSCSAVIFIRQFAEPSCATVVGFPIVVSAANAGGAISGSYQGSYAAGTKGILAEMLVSDEALNSAFIGSSCMLVDNELPHISKAETMRSGAQQNLLKVTLNECVTGSIELLDFSVTNNFVTQSSQPSCTIVGGSPRTVVTLTTLLPFPDDDPSGVVRYEPFMTVGGSLRDGVRNVMIPHEVPIQDGIPS